jgi:hypothetical protein
MRFLNVFLAIALTTVTSVRGTASATDVYIAQAAAGSANGSSCVNAHAYSFFNTSGNWGAGASQIGPGTTVHLCGTIGNALTAQGSGAAGSPITILFDAATSGQISMPYLPTTGALVLNNQSYFTVNGQNTGIIQSTNNGSPASLCPGSPYTNSVVSKAISANTTTGVEIKNLTLGPIYVHLCTADDFTNNPPLVTPGPIAVEAAYGSASLTIDGNTIHDCDWCIFGGSNGQNNISINHNTIYNMDHGAGFGMALASGVMNGFYFYNNHLYGANVWDSNDKSYHHDGIHLFAYCANGSSFCSGTYIENVFIYDNTFDGLWGSNVNAMVYLEENIGPNTYVFNNYFNGSQMVIWGLGQLSARGNGVTAYNNTIVGFSTSAAITGQALLAGPVVLRNNILATANSLVSTGTDGGSGSPSTYSFSNNIYANGGGNAWVWDYPPGTYFASTQFSLWVSHSGETKSTYAGSTSSSAGVNANGTLAPSSPARSAGANLYSVCNGQPNPGLGALCYDAASIARPLSGAWDAGAYQYTTSPSPPTNLIAVPQ